MTWTRFMDMHSGGGLKEEWQYIYIEASLEEAKSVFYSRFGHNPERVTCTCCGEDYSISEYKTLEEATAYDRHCYWAYPKNDRFGSEGNYFESLDAVPEGWKVNEFHWGVPVSVSEFIKAEENHFIYSDSIRNEERTTQVPEQGYVWID